MIKKINIGEIISAGWKITSSNFLSLLGLLLVLLVVNIVLSVPSDILETKELTLGLVVYNILVSVIGMIMGMGLIKIVLDVVSGGKVEFMKLFTTYKNFLNYFLSSLLLTVIIVLPLAVVIGAGVASVVLTNKNSVAMIVAGLLCIAAIVYIIYMSIRLSFNKYFIIDRGVGPVEALKLSYKATNGQVTKLIVLQLALIGINLIGILLVLLGLLFTIPLTMVISAVTYKQLVSSIEPEQEKTDSIKTEEALNKIAAGEPVVQ